MDKKLLKSSWSNDAQTEDTLTRHEARLRGLVLYWNGENCTNGHESPRYVKTGMCKECIKLAHKKQLKLKNVCVDKGR